jgi:hypothetical protein
MQLPNKLFTYSESILSKLPIILKALEKEPLSVSSLYIKLQNQIPSINEYIEILDALYSLNRVEYCDEQEVLRYVVRD